MPMDVLGDEVKWFPPSQATSSTSPGHSASSRRRTPANAKEPGWHWSASSMLPGASRSTTSVTAAGWATAASASPSVPPGSAVEASRRPACAPSASPTRARLSTAPTATASNTQRWTEVKSWTGNRRSLSVIFLTCGLKVPLHKMYYCYLIQTEPNISDLASIFWCVNTLNILHPGLLQNSLTELIIIHQISLNLESRWRWVH